MPPARSVLDPSNGRLIDPRTGRPLGERDWFPAPPPPTPNAEAFRRLQEYAEAAGVHLDLRPGTVGRTLVDGILSLHTEHEAMIRQIYQGLRIPYNPDISMGATVRQGWEMHEIDGGWAFNETALRRLTRQQEQRISQEMDRVATEGFDPPRRVAEMNPDPHFMEISYVTDPPDPRTAIRNFTTGGDLSGSYPAPVVRRVNVPEFPLEANPTIRIDDIRARGPMLRAQLNAVSIEAEENKRILAELEKHAQGLGPPPAKAHVFYPTAWEHLLKEDPF